MNVTLKNPLTNELKDVKIGWSWTLFLFTQFLGIPLFLRKLNQYGVAACALSLSALMLGSSPDGSFGDVVSTLCAVAIWVLSVFLGVKGNELTAKNFLQQGWLFSNPESEVTIFGKKTWNIQE